MVLKLITLLALLSFTGLAAQPADIEREFKVAAGKTLNLDLNTGGSVDIAGWDQDVVKVSVTLGGRDGKDCSVDFEETSEGVTVTSRYNGPKDNRSANLVFEIRVPRKFQIEFQSMGGAVTLSDVEGEITGTTMGGQLNLSGLKGRLGLTTMGGAIIMRGCDVDGTVRTMGGAVRMEDVTGDVQATSLGGAVSQKNVKHRSDGSASKEVKVSTMGGDIEIDDAPLGTDVHTMGGDIHVASAARFARTKTMGGNIRLDAVDGAITATTMGGDIEALMTGTEGDRSVDLESMAGDVTLTLPAGLSARFDLSLAYTRDSDQDYRIESDFPLNQETSKEWDNYEGSPRKYIVGTGSVDGGKNLVKIRTVNGNVTIKRK